MPLPRNLVRLIESLRLAWPAGRTADALASELNIQTWRVSEMLGRLEHMSLPLEHTGQSVRLDPADTPLLADLVELGLETKRIGRSVIVFEQTASTNDVAWQAARRRESDGLVVLAETQAAGRGRLGRPWFDRPGASLLFSVLLLDVERAEGLANRLVMSASVALAEAIQEATGLTAAIRWPNDLYLHGRKVAGILLESSPGRRRGMIEPRAEARGSVAQVDASPPSLHPRASARGSAGEGGQYPLSQTDAKRGAGPIDVVVGVGLNCNQSAEDFPPELKASAASLAMELGGRVDRIGLMRAILRRLDRWLGGETDRDPFSLHGEYLRWTDHQARRVRVHHGTEVIEATVRDVDPINGLIVELAAGGVAHFAPAAVSIEWLGG